MDIVQSVEQLYVAQLVPCSSQGILRLTFSLWFFLIARVVQLVRTLISCVKYENSSFSSGLAFRNAFGFKQKNTALKLLKLSLVKTHYKLFGVISLREYSLVGKTWSFKLLILSSSLSAPENGLKQKQTWSCCNKIKGLELS